MSKIRDDSIVPIRKRQIQQLLQPLPSPKSRRTSSLSSITSNKNATSVAAATTTTSSPSVPLFPAILGDAAGGTVGSLPTNEHLLHSSSLLPRSTVRRQSAEAKLLELAACLERCAQLLSSLMVDNSIAHAGSAAITTTTPTVTATDSGPDMSSLPNAAILISNAEGVVSEDALVFAKATATSPTPTPTTKKGFQFPVSSAPNSFSVLPPQQQQLLKLHVESFRKMSTVFSTYNTSAPTSRKPSFNTNDSHNNSSHSNVPTTGEVEEEVEDASLAPSHELPPTAVEAQHQHYLLHHQHLLQLQQLLGLPEQQPLSRLSPRASVFCPDEELATSNDGGDEREKTTTTTTNNNSDKINDSQRTQWGTECQQDMAVFDDIGTGIALSGGAFANSVMMMMMDPAIDHIGLPVLSEDEDADVVVGDKSQASQLDDDSLHPPPMPLHPSSPEQEKPSVFQRLRRNSSKTNLSLDGIEKLFRMVQAAHAFLTEEFLSRLDPEAETISKNLATTMMATTTSSSASPSPTHQRLRTPSGTSYFALFPTSTMGGGGVHESSSSASPTQPKAPLLPNQHQGSGSGAHSPIRLSARPSIAEFATSATALANLCKASTSSIFAFPPPPSAQQYHHVPPTNHVIHNSSANASGTGGAAAAALNAYSGRSPPHLFLFSPLAHNVTTSTSSREQSSDTQSVKQVSLQVTTTTLTKSNDEFTGNKIINQYLILNDIGEGACGKVKLAYSLERNITVAIKVVRRAVGGVVSGKGRALGRRGSLKEDAVRHEVELMKRLRHPNLVSLFEMIDDPNAEKLYLVMRFADKGSVGAMREDLTCDAMPL
ncbi:protein kinase, putative, partial [Bodo saltans]